MRVFETKSIEQTKAKAAELAKELKKGSVIGFLGDLGAGKTAFTGGFVEGLGIDADVSSPTFAICNDYIGSENRVLHYDMYRIESWEDLYSTGFFDSLESDAYILVEWSENVFGALPDDAVIIRIEKLGENERRFTVMNKNEAEQLS
ncbi:MAG: tRNA (adenosine(37)-N6)-threonylcarbamoyltransferase complex ATPase subunit type 1 TsaE [Eubacterium sp.]|jgi:tRNA threonylcarbamoyladenosine biosynthesis protein TsaE|nr:tRNA (adenosine(37)-N6)-threonylcarbamoyltransferase complex ATPase subunit type 1 TsaE [Eubacterium sp.]